MAAFPSLAEETGGGERLGRGRNPSSSFALDFIQQRLLCKVGFCLACCQPKGRALGFEQGAKFKGAWL